MSLLGKAGKWLKKNGGRVAIGVATGGLSEVDRATGSNVGKAIDKAGDWISNADPTKVGRADTSQLDARVSGFADKQKAFADALGGVTNREVPQLQSAQMQGATIANGETAQSRAAQQEGINLLREAALGNAPSAAQLQLQRGQENAVAAGQAALASSRGGYSGAAARQAAVLAATGQQRANQDSAILRAQEMAQARGGFASALDAARGQDITMATSQAGLVQDTNKTNAGFLQDTNKTNVSNTLTGRSLDDTAQNNLRGLGVQLELGALGVEQGKVAAEQARQGQIAGAKSALIGGAVNGVAGAATTALLSDERTKTNVSQGSKGINEFLNALESKRYEYKDQANGAGPQYGIMAQDAEQTAAGKTMVNERPDGTKELDMKAGFGLILASQAELNKRLKAMETKKKAG